MSEDYRLTCRHCGGRFVEMVDLAFHPCPPQSDTHKSRRKGDRRPGRGKPSPRARSLKNSIHATLQIFSVVPSTQETRGRVRKVGCRGVRQGRAPMTRVDLKSSACVGSPLMSCARRMVQ